MLHVTASAPPPSSFAARQGVHPKSPALLSKMSQSDSILASAVLIVPVYDETQHGADLLMLPIFTPGEEEEKEERKMEEEVHVNPSRADRRHQHTQHPQRLAPDQSSRTTTPAAPTPPPKPQLPDGCQDWDHYLSQKKSSMTLPIFYDNRNPAEDSQQQQQQQQIRSPEVTFNHSFEDYGWRDCLSQRHKQHQHHQQQQQQHMSSSSAATIGCGASLRARRFSNASTLTAATMPILGGCGSGSSSSGLSIRSAKRLSGASYTSIATTSSSLSSGGGGGGGAHKRPRGLRRICHSRHLRTYYSEGTSLLIRAAAAGGGSLRRHRLHRLDRGQNLNLNLNLTGTIREQREPVDLDRQQLQEQLLQQRRRGVVVNHPHHHPDNNNNNNTNNDGVSIKSYSTTGRKRLSAFSTLSMPVSLTEYSAPPPYPPPEKPLPSVPGTGGLAGVKTKTSMMTMTSEVRELHTKERTKWRELLLRGIQRMDTGRRRIHIG